MNAPAQEEKRTKVLGAAVTPEEKDAAELAVRVDRMVSVSEALRTRTVDELIERGRELLDQLAQLSPPEAEVA